METNYLKIIDQIESIDPVNYSKNRNFIDGSVTKLSPYISRGLISTKYVFEKILERNIPFWKVEKFVQELCWRDYWQLIWKQKGNLIDADLKRIQDGVSNHSLSKALIDGNCGIKAIDNSINELYDTGYMHNHNRMYLASIACNVAKSHWLNPARWMYYNLLDGDWGSNALSWQWVCGSNSNKKYYANQENINKNALKIAMKNAVIYDFINNLPLKEKTIVGENGKSLSGGQIQRIGIARALYKDPSILIFDESTNSLDMNTEKEFMDVLRKLKNDRTIIFVTHKLELLNHCDKVFQTINNSLKKVDIKNLS